MKEQVRASTPMPGVLQSSGILAMEISVLIRLERSVNGRGVLYVTDAVEGDAYRAHVVAVCDYIA